MFFHNQETQQVPTEEVFGGAAQQWAESLVNVLTSDQTEGML